MSDVTPNPALRTRFCELVGVKYPVVQTGLGRWCSLGYCDRPRRGPRNFGVGDNDA